MASTGCGHGVVDEQGQRDDERAPRYALQVDTGYVHDGKDDGESQRNRERDDQSGPDTKADEARRDDDQIACHSDVVNSPIA